MTKSKRIPMTIEEIALHIHWALAQAGELTGDVQPDDCDPATSAMICVRYLRAHPSFAFKTARMSLGRFARIPLIDAQGEEQANLEAVRVELHRALERGDVDGGSGIVVKEGS
jgi:hypothetical protein